MDDLKLRGDMMFNIGTLSGIAKVCEYSDPQEVSELINEIALTLKLIMDKCKLMKIEEVPSCDGSEISDLMKEREEASKRYKDCDCKHE